MLKIRVELRQRLGIDGGLENNNNIINKTTKIIII
jgi:hypothetical protein